MKSIVMPAVLALALTAGAGATCAPAQAAGCLKGAAVGGVAGHMAGHHGALGAGAGCVVGHHEAKKAARSQGTQNPAPGSNGAPANATANGSSR